MSKQVQSIVSLSPENKTWLESQVENFIAPSPSKPEGLPASLRELVDSAVELAKANPEGYKTEVERTLAMRGSSTRTSAKARAEKAEAELNETLELLRKVNPKAYKALMEAQEKAKSSDPEDAEAPAEG